MSAIRISWTSLWLSIWISPWDWPINDKEASYAVNNLDLTGVVLVLWERSIHIKEFSPMIVTLALVSTSIVIGAPWIWAPMNKRSSQDLHSFNKTVLGHFEVVVPWPPDTTVSRFPGIDQTFDHFVPCSVYWGRTHGLFGIAKNLSLFWFLWNLDWFSFLILLVKDLMSFLTWENSSRIKFKVSEWLDWSGCFSLIARTGRFEHLCLSANRWVSSRIAWASASSISLGWDSWILSLMSLSGMASEKWSRDRIWWQGMGLVLEIQSAL